ncbi:MAG: zinc-binding dehydrogenase [Raoultibacter sp.]|jgi:threonine dehydrogenase-like Zn-dependent dehydrogenase
MKAYIIKEPGKACYADKPYPSCDEFGAIIKTIAVTPCTSDVSNVYKSTNPASLGNTLGHEAIGEVVEVGSKVKDCALGDRVMIPSITPDYLFTHDHQASDVAQHSGGFLHGYLFTNVIDGVFSEYFSVPQADQNLALIPEGVTDEQALMIVDMMNTGFRGSEVADIECGDTVVVYGIGPVGLMAVAGATLQGAARIVAVGNRPVTMELAKAYGATDCIDYKEGPVAKQVRALMQGKPVDRVIVAGGTVDAVTEAFKMVRPGGLISNIVYFAGSGEIKIPLNLWGGGMSDKRLVTSSSPGGRLRMERMAALVQYGKVDPGLLVTHRFEGVDSIEEAFEIMHSHPKDLIKPMVRLAD